METARQDLDATATVLSQAVSAAEAGRNTYRAMHDAVEALRKAQSAVQGLRELDALRASVEKETQALQERKAELGREVARLQALAKDVQTAADRDVASAKERAAEGIRAARERVLAAEREAAQAREEARLVVERAGETQRKALAPLRAERDALQARVDGLKAELAGLVAKYQG